MIRQCFLVGILVLCSQAYANSAPRSYPVPQLFAPVTWQSHYLKGRVKSRNSDCDGYLQMREYSPEGRLVFSSVGRSGVVSETRYWYELRGWMVKTQATQLYNYEEDTIDVRYYEYEFDELGYPLTVFEISAGGDTLAMHSYEYADSVYSLTSMNLANEDEYGYSYVTVSLFNSRGEITEKVVFNTDNGEFDKTRYAYIPEQFITIESSDYEDGLPSLTVRTRKNPAGRVLERSSYDGSDRLITQLTCTYDGQDNLLSESWVFAAYGSIDTTSYEYEFDAQGNILTQTVSVNGEVDEVTRFSYVYY